MKTRTIYHIYTVDYKGNNTHKGILLTIKKAKQAVNEYMKQGIKATYEADEIESQTTWNA